MTPTPATMKKNAAGHADPSSSIGGAPRRGGAAPPATLEEPMEVQHIRAGRRLAALSWFTRQLYVLVISGMPLVQAIASLERQAKDEQWARVLHDVRSNLESGASLAEAMESQPHCFDSVYRSLIAAGESGGELEAMLKRLGSLMAQQMKTRRTIVGAMIYPTLLIVIALGALSAMLTVVLPRFAGLFETLDVPLPPTTQWLVGISTVVRAHWWIILSVAAALGGGLALASHTDGGRRLRDAACLRLPKLGPLVRDFATERIARLLGVLISSNVSVLEAMALVRQAMGNVYYVELLESAEQAVGRGEPISSVLADASLINPSVHEAVRSGEQSGQVGPLLVDIADFLDEENRSAIQSLTSILEPVILIALGLIIGFVAVSLFLPLFDLTSMT
ncbi:MAG: type II secretion system F family protein [Planctomycetota bacterium]|nr:type II secretion system F family protein [Planctomycetota bacterium]